MRACKPVGKGLLEAAALALVIGFGWIAQVAAQDGARIKEKLAEIKITSDQGAVFDTEAKTAIFKGDVIVTHPSFTLTSDKLVVYINEDGIGLDYAIATGYVTIRREGAPPATEGGKSRNYVGKARKAIFRSKEQTVELTDWPQIQQDNSLHIATERSTVMILDQHGTLTTRGGSRTVVPDREDQ